MTKTVKDKFHPICDHCETVAHCSKHGCIPVRAEEPQRQLQKPALHEPCTELEAIEALKQSDLAAEIYGGRSTPMQAAVNSVLQGRAKPAQEEITDADLCAIWEMLPATALNDTFNTALVAYARAILRASKGEKT